MNEKTRTRLIDYFCGAEGNDPIEKCARLAYKDVQRTLRGIGNLPEKEKYIEEICTFISSCIRNISISEEQVDFDRWHDNTCEEIIKKSEVFPQFKNKIARSNNKHFHHGQAQKWLNITLKNMVIFELQDKYPILVQIKEYLHIPIDQYIINGTHVKRPKGAVYEWSRWDSPQYNDYQKALRGIIPLEKTPIEWEIEEWPKFKKEFSL